MKILEGKKRFWEVYAGFYLPSRRGFCAFGWDMTFYDCNIFVLWIFPLYIEVNW